jgi:DMSO/TMAO reductase YedYZ heme-binding membrane subunit
MLLSLFEVFTTSNFLIILLIFLLLIIAFYFGRKPLEILKLWGWILLLNIFLGFLINLFTGFGTLAIIINSTGYTSLLVIMAALVAGPGTRVLRGKFFKILLKHRRNIGVGGFLMAFLHYILNWNFTFVWDFKIFELLADPSTDYGKGIFIGFNALLIFAVAAFISNKKSKKFLGPKIWKFLQLFCYFSLFLIIFHVLLLGSLFDKSILLKILFWAAFLFTFGLKLADIYLKYSKNK